MTVLLVEDNSVVRLTLVDFLEEAGLDVLDAGDAKDALAMITDPAQHIDILVTDLDLGPGDNGLVLAANARMHLPNLQIVYATGSPEILSGHILSPWEKAFFKPFDPVALVATVSVLGKMSRSQRPALIAHTAPPSMRCWARRAATSASPAVSRPDQDISASEIDAEDHLAGPEVAGMGQAVADAEVQPELLC
jgi:CheY-like chemotaxis protein